MPRPKRKKASGQCVCCRREFAFCWKCRCGFAICQPCMDGNTWGMTCNGVTWECPDCGAWNNYGSF
ncbi:MAG: hypothetical protein ABIJ96_05835 [Elusimicrobiota bacterium]